MQALTTCITTIGEFLRLTPRQVAGVVLVLMNASGDLRDHPRTLHLDAERAYPGPHASDAGDLMAAAVALMLDEGFATRDYRDMVDNDWFRLTEKGKSIRDRSQVEEVAALIDAGKPLVFISCGQFTESERTLGKRMCDIIREHTDYVPYFAENQQSFEGLSTSILASLHKMSGMVVVMHRRGEVTTPDERFQRASVWIEQEIAIAASLQHAGRGIKVAAYVQDGIKREGLRELLHLNPVVFTTDEEVALNFERLVVSGALRAGRTSQARTSGADAARDGNGVHDWTG